jgi:hypothetical protein
LGGLAFLAKSYALPFFVAHYFFSVAIYYVERRSDVKASNAVSALTIGFLAFAVVAAPWIATVSWKCGKPTFSTAGPFNHYLIGPEVGPDKWEVLHHAQPIQSGRITIWETPEKLSFQDWSPLASTAAMKHQVKYVARNARRIADAFCRFDLIGFVPGMLLLWPAVRWAGRRRNACGGLSVAWALMTILVYAGGYLPLPFETRYVELSLYPLCCIAVFCVLEELRSLALSEGRSWAIAFGMSLLGLVCAFSFAAKSAGKIGENYSAASAFPSPYRVCGEKLSELGVQKDANIVATDWHTGLYVAYHASLPFLGKVNGGSAAEIEKQLNEHHATVFVVTSAWSPFKEFLRDTHWRQVRSARVGDDDIFVFLPPKNANR